MQNGRTSNIIITYSAIDNDNDDNRATCIMIFIMPMPMLFLLLLTMTMAMAMWMIMMIMLCMFALPRVFVLHANAHICHVKSQPKCYVKITHAPPSKSPPLFPFWPFAVWCMVSSLPFSYPQFGNIFIKYAQSEVAIPWQFIKCTLHCFPLALPHRFALQLDHLLRSTPPLPKYVVHPHIAQISFEIALQWKMLPWGGKTGKYLSLFFTYFKHGTSKDKITLDNLISK